VNGQAQLVAICGMVTLAISCIVSVTICTAVDKPVPVSIVTLLGVAGGAIATFLVPYRAAQPPAKQ
jgi:hypothetical protein